MAGRTVVAATQSRIACRAFLFAAHSRLVGRGAVLGEGCILNRGIPVIDAETGDEISRGVVPPWCVAVTATRPRRFPGGEFGLPCLLVIRRLEEGRRHDSAQLNELLREHGVSV